MKVLGKCNQGNANADRRLPEGRDQPYSVVIVEPHPFEHGDGIDYTKMYYKRRHASNGGVFLAEFKRWAGQSGL